MPKVVPNPNDRLWDSLVQSGRQTAGLAQQQTQVYQDWTRPDPKPIIPFFNPEGVAVSPDGKYAYVCNSDLYITYGANGSISKIDLTTRAVIDVFPATSVGTPPCRMMPQYIAVSPDGTKLYWSSYNGDYAFCSSATDGSALDLWSVGGIRHVRIDSSGTYVCFVQGNVVWCVDIESNLMASPHYSPPDGNVGLFDIGFLGMGGWTAGFHNEYGYLYDFDLPATSLGRDPLGLYNDPAGVVAFDFDLGSVIYTAIPNGNKVICYGSITTTITVGNQPLNMAVTPDFAEVWVVNVYDGTISVINVGTNTVTHTIPFGTAGTSGYSIDWDIAADPGGVYMYVTHGVDGTFSIINRATYSVVKVLP
jgi:YVTN family beta-propeller protein